MWLTRVACQVSNPYRAALIKATLAAKIKVATLAKPKQKDIVALAYAKENLAWIQSKIDKVPCTFDFANTVLKEATSRAASREAESTRALKHASDLSARWSKLFGRNTALQARLTAIAYDPKIALGEDAGAASRRKALGNCAPPDQDIWDFLGRVEADNEPKKNPQRSQIVRDIAQACARDPFRLVSHRMDP